MRRTAFASATAALVFLAGCNGPAEPSAPPTSEDALTTATTDPVATTEEPTEGDEAAVTTEAAATTQLPTVGDPTKDTEEGADAAVQRYLNTLSAGHLGEGDADALRKLSVPDCLSCDAFADGIEERPLGHAFIRYLSSRSIVTGDVARVEADVEQVDNGQTVSTVFHLVWEGDEWLVSEIQLSAD